MTCEEIIKALECCTNETDNMCEFCPFLEKFNSVSRNALDLINRQKEEIERWKIECESLRMAGNSLKMHLEKAEKEIERLQSVNADVQESLRLSAEANKDMQAEIERLREAKYIFATVDYCSDDLHEALDEIDRLNAEIEALKKVVVDDYATEYDEKIKAEAIIEFAERLKKEAITKCDWGDCVDVEDIDDLAKEMTGEQK